MKSKLNKYLEQHAIICIGRNNADIIVDSPIDFIKRIEKMGYCICEILWWERRKIRSSNNSIGYGGPTDPRDKEYFFSETDISKRFVNYTSCDEIIYYLNETYQKYSNYDLYPSFTLVLI